jgi:hypothetical protein
MVFYSALIATFLYITIGVIQYSIDIVTTKWLPLFYVAIIILIAIVFMSGCFFATLNMYQGFEFIVFLCIIGIILYNMYRWAQPCSCFSY